MEIELSNYECTGINTNEQEHADDIKLCAGTSAFKQIDSSEVRECTTHSMEQTKRPRHGGDSREESVIGGCLFGVQIKLEPNYDTDFVKSEPFIHADEIKLSAGTSAFKQIDASEMRECTTHSMEQTKRPRHGGDSREKSVTDGCLFGVQIKLEPNYDTNFVKSEPFNHADEIKLNARESAFKQIDSSEVRECSTHSMEQTNAGDSCEKSVTDGCLFGVQLEQNYDINIVKSAPSNSDIKLEDTDKHYDQTLGYTTDTSRKKLNIGRDISNSMNDNHTRQKIFMRRVKRQVMNLISVQCKPRITKKRSRTKVLLVKI